MKTTKTKKKTTRYSIYGVLILLLSVFSIKAQTPNSVGIGTTNPHNSAVLHLESNRQGFLMTRLNTAQITSSVITPSVGLIIFNTDDQCYWYKRTNYWARLCNTDSINAVSVITNIFQADTAIINHITFGTAYGDSIFVHYLHADTAVINNLTVNIIQGDTAIFNYGNFNVLNTDTIINNYLTSHMIKTDSIYVGGTPIQTVITDSITSMAWLLNGNLGTNPASKFLGTIDNQDLVFRTNNTERMRTLASGLVGINTPAPTQQLDVNGKIRLRTGATNTWLLQSDGAGTGTWADPATIFSGGPTGPLNGSGWTILGNAGTNATTNFVGTTDAQDFVVRTNNTQKGKFYSSALDYFSYGSNNNMNSTTFGNGYPYISATVTELNLATQYIGFNVKRNPTNNNVNVYDAIGNGTNNGSSMILANELGDLRFATMASTGGGNLTYGVSQASNAIKFGMLSNGQFMLRSAATNNTPNISFLGVSTFSTSGLSLMVGSTDFIYNGVNSVRFNNSTYVSSVAYGSSVNALFDQNTTNYNGLVPAGLFIHGKNNNIANPVGGGGGTNSLRIFGSLNNFMIAGTNNSYNNTVIGDRNVISIPAATNLSWVANNFFATSSSTITAPASTAMNNMFVLGNGLNTTNAFTGFWGYFPNGAAPGTLVNSNSSVRFLGGNGFTFYTNDLGTTGVSLAPGGGSWATVSDRRLKENIKPVDHKSILALVLKTEVTEWMYESQRPDEFNKFEKQPLHIGPMAQDFSEIFKYGEYEDKITTGDMDGVLFASVKALAEENSDLKEKLEKQASDIEELKKLINELKNK